MIINNTKSMRIPKIIHQIWKTNMKFIIHNPETGNLANEMIKFMVAKKNRQRTAQCNPVKLHTSGPERRICSQFFQASNDLGGSFGSEFVVCPIRGEGILNDEVVAMICPRAYLLDSSFLRNNLT
jgi:hypothetical protein